MTMEQSSCKQDSSSAFEESKMLPVRGATISKSNYNFLRLIAKVVIQTSGLIFLLASAATAQQVENHNEQPLSSRTGNNGNGWADVLIATLATDGSFSTSNKQNQSVPSYTLSSDNNNDNDIRIKSLASDNAKNETTNSPDAQARQEQDDYSGSNSNGSSDDLNLNAVDAAQDRLHAMTSLLNAATASEDLSDGSMELAPRSGEPKSSFTALDTGK